jgi:putative aminopeptidase FrvX
LGYLSDFIRVLNLILPQKPFIKVNNDNFDNIIIDIKQDFCKRNILIEAHYDEIPLSMADDLILEKSNERFDYVFSNLNNIVKSIGLDNKVSLSAILYSIDSLSKIASQTKTNIRIIFSAGEETRKTKINHLFPTKLDFYIVMDAAYAKPTDFDQQKGVLIPNIGDGTVIQIEGQGFKISKEIISFVENIAEKNSIKYQIELPPKGLGYTNCAIFQKFKLKNGVVLNTPVRYQHKKVSEVSLYDIEQTSRLLINIIKKLSIIESDNKDF